MFRLLHEAIATFLSVNTASLKKVKLNIESLHSAKLKEEKALKSGKKSVKGKSVKMDLDKVRYAVSFLWLFIFSQSITPYANLYSAIISF